MVALTVQVVAHLLWDVSVRPVSAAVSGAAMVGEVVLHEAGHASTFLLGGRRDVRVIFGTQFVTRTGAECSRLLGIVAAFIGVFVSIGFLALAWASIVSFAVPRDALSSWAVVPFAYAFIGVVVGFVAPEGDVRAALSRSAP